MGTGEFPLCYRYKTLFLATEFEDGNADASDAPCFRGLGGVESHIYIYYILCVALVLLSVIFGVSAAG